jgi:hypothetical protein
MTRGKPDIRKSGLGAFEGIAPVEKLKRQSHILDRGHGRDQMERLKHNADRTAPRLCEFVLGHSRKVPTGNQHLPGGCGFEPCHHHQEGRFSRAARPYKRNRLPFRHGEVDAAQNFDRSRSALECERDAL